MIAADFVRRRRLQNRVPSVSHRSRDPSTSLRVPILHHLRWAKSGTESGLRIASQNPREIGGFDLSKDEILCPRANGPQNYGRFLEYEAYVLRRSAESEELIRCKQGTPPNFLIVLDLTAGISTACKEP